MRLAAAVATFLLAGCLAAGPSGDDVVPRNAPFLLADRYPTLRVAVHHVEGWEPSQFALDGLLEEMLRATGRSSIDLQASVELTGLSSGPDGIWSGNELGQVLDRTKPDDKTTIVLAFLDGGIEKRNGATRLGISFGEFALVFPQEFEQISLVTVGGTGLPRPNGPELERSVAIHEVGHVLGLVETGVPRVHGPLSTDDCRCHSGDEGSVMYYAADTDANPAFLAGVESAQISYRFTQDDIDDIRAFQRSYGFEP